MGYTMSYYQPSPLPNKKMWEAFNELMKRDTFRVVDVEKITGDDYYGMLYARHI